MTHKLFSEFSPVSAKQWKQNIQFGLKGADYNNTLVWNTNEDIAVKPFYHADDFDQLPQVSQTKATQWKICQSIFVANVEKSNRNAVNAIKKGAESILFIISNDTFSITDLIKNIDLKKVTIHLEPTFLSEELSKKLAQLPINSNHKNGIQIHTDIINNLAKTGNWFHNLKADFEKFENIVKYANSFSVNGSLYQNSGATMVQQLAYALAHANEYLNYFKDKLDKEAKKQLKVTFKVSIGNHYFFEIAKLRALRKLWKVLALEYEINTNCFILSQPSKRNKTIYDYNNNMLRTTTECMSAILGGSDTICNIPYDAVYHKTNNFGERISRNQLLILKHESHFNTVNNPADGAYYIETITNQLAKKALDLFKDIEANGGFLKQLKEGTIQRKIKESANKEQLQFNTGETVLLGANKYLNLTENMQKELEIYPFVKTKQRKTLIDPIIENRLSENLELNRIKNEH